jgi:hypothetical protein
MSKQVVKQFGLTVNGNNVYQVQTSGTTLCIKLHNNQTKETQTLKYDISKLKGMKLKLKDNDGNLLGKEWGITYNIE